MLRFDDIRSDARTRTTYLINDKVRTFMLRKILHQFHHPERKFLAFYHNQVIYFH